MAAPKDPVYPTIAELGGRIEAARNAAIPQIWSENLMKHLMPEQLATNDTHKATMLTGSAMGLSSGGILQSTKRYVEPTKTLKFTPIKNGYLVINGNEQHYCEDLDKIAATVVSLLAAHMLELEP